MVEAHIVREGVFASSISSYDRVHRQRSGTVPVTFPPSKDIMINMMPIRIGVDEDVPKEYQQYLPLLHACPAWADPKSRDESHFSFMRDGVERVGYLTIHESRIEEDETSQRRGGLHTETPGCVGAGGEWVPASAPGALTVAWGGGFAELDSSGDEGGDTTYTYRGGIYMASSVADSTRVWNVKVDKPQEVVGTLGDLEHLRGRLGEGATLKAGELCWMTDATPHESLPLPKGTYRQYFRLVTSDVNVWYSKHSTPNPLGIKPGKMVKIVDGDKFAMAAASSSAVGVVSRAMAAMESSRDQLICILEYTQLHTALALTPPLELLVDERRLHLDHLPQPRDRARPREQLGRACGRHALCALTHAAASHIDIAYPVSRAVGVSPSTSISSVCSAVDVRA